MDTLPCIQKGTQWKLSLASSLPFPHILFFFFPDKVLILFRHPAFPLCPLEKTQSSCGNNWSNGDVTPFRTLLVVQKLAHNTILTSEEI